MLERIASLRELLAVPTKDSGEAMINIKKTITCSNKFGMSEPDTYFLVRSTLQEKLCDALNQLRSQDSNLQLMIMSAYRTPEMQRKKFFEMVSIKALEEHEDPYELYESTHRLIAHPSVAGHPTGAAIDILIADKAGIPLEFGTPPYDFSHEEACRTFYVGVSPEAQKNRMLLRDIMLSVGFAPFDGEWWHFSYGDREWAWYYDQDCAIYAPIDPTNLSQ